MPTLQELLPFIVVFIAAIKIRDILFTKKHVLDPRVYRHFKLINKEQISHDTALYRFRLPRPDDILQVYPGQHVAIMAEINGKKISRSYTPTNESPGQFELLIKSYPTGNISKLMGELKEGDSVCMRGPKGSFKYTRNMVKSFGMVAGGTGITPMLQIIRQIWKDPKDDTTVHLIFANRTENDILLKKDLDEMQNDQIKIHYVLEKPPSDWSQDIGLVTKEMIQKYLPSPDNDDIKILLCGPLPMMKSLTDSLNTLGYKKPRAVSKTEDQVYRF
ncbi:ferredoxin reductase-like protein [Backusella circina FSU 941]|nr:ferredoxin reductase-like protein [Backusella circina FSU 941]